MTTKEKTALILREWGSLKGKTIQQVRPLTADELAAMDWDNYGNNQLALVVQFTDGSYIVPMSDPEGNSAGFLLYSEMDS